MSDQKELINQLVLQQQKSENLHSDLPPIPEKIYFSIGEVSELCQLKPHVLRYWEQEFSQLNPSKRRGNRRYYQRKDVLLVRHIKSLLYRQGFTIDGARAQLNAAQDSRKNPQSHLKLQQAISQLEKLADELEA